MSQYDLPAMINHILKTSNAPNLYYIGHSMGTLTMFVRLAQDKEFAKKVSGIFKIIDLIDLN
jgi:lysosomal acid lipase/cholesteryl ester hydrolase